MGFVNDFLGLWAGLWYDTEKTKGERPMKLVSWNVNGLRSCLTKGFLEYVKQEDPDIVCLQ